MALNASTMATTVVDNLEPYNPRLAGAARDRAILYWTAICQGIIDHLKSDMDVLPVSHTGLNLNNPSGQALSVPALGIEDSNHLACTGVSTTGETSAEQDITGTGSVV